jgi:hypothetical protein
VGDGLSCDRCGKTLLVEEDVRYVCEMRLYAAYDTLELTRGDLEKDHRAEIARLCAEIERRDPESLMDEVARALKFDLCPACHRKLLADPLGKGSAI